MSRDQDVEANGIGEPGVAKSRSQHSDRSSQRLTSETTTSTPVDISNQQIYNFPQRFKRFFTRSGKLAGLEYNHRLEPEIKSFDEFPNGYPKLAAIAASDKDFLILKKYSWLRTRVLFNIQDELLELQDKLNNFDSHDEEHDPTRLISRRKDEGYDTARKNLLHQIAQKLAEYDELLFRTHKLNALETPTVRNQNSVFNAITSNQTDSEAAWVRDRDDLVAVAPDQERSRLNAVVEDSIKFVSRRLALLLFRTSSQRRRTGSTDVYLLSRERLDAVTNVLITIIATILLLLPIAILYRVPLQALGQVGLIFAFVLIFALCSALFTRARKQEVFAASAAYAAVLVVFLSNNIAPIVTVVEGGGK